MADVMVDWVRSQVDAFIAEIERIEGSEFPYAHSKDCVEETKKLFLANREALAEITPGSTRDSVELVCNAALSHIRQNLDLLGFLLRSTNVRNAFEAYGPLLRMAASALGPGTRLVISSEWTFSPFTYVGVPHLPNTVLVGMPATESSNPLLLPLAGHEFGHSAWDIFGLVDDIPQRLEVAITNDIDTNWSSLSKFFAETKKEDVATDLLARAFWIVAWSWANRQCEEYFCDIFGLRLFGESFLHAFAYLLAPYTKGKRFAFYPGLVARARSLEKAATAMGIPVPSGYSTSFKEMPLFGANDERENAQLSLADRVSDSMISELIERVITLLPTSRVPSQSEDLIAANLKRLRLLVPTERAGGLPNILAAAWRARLTPTLIGLDKMESAERVMLSEIVWKSIEIDEIEYRLSQS